MILFITFHSFNFKNLLNFEEFKLHKNYKDFLLWVTHLGEIQRYFIYTAHSLSLSYSLVTKMFQKACSSVIKVKKMANYWIMLHFFVVLLTHVSHMDRVKRIWYLSPMRAAKVQASLRIRAVSPEPPLLANASSESRGTFRQKARSLAPLNGWACTVKICHDGMLEDTNSLDGAHIAPMF